MAESKYAIRIAAHDGFSQTFESLEAKSSRLKEEISAQNAEIRRLNNTSKRIDGMQRMQGALETTTADLKKARQEQSRLSREQEQARAAAQSLSSDYAKADARVRRLSESTRASAADIKAASAEHKRLAGEVSRADSAVRSLDAKQDKARASVKTLEAAQRSQRNELLRTDEELKKAGIDTGRLADEQKRLESATERANTALASQRSRLSAVTQAQSKVDANRAARADLHGRMLETAAVGYIASKPITQAWDLETAMADVGKVYDFDSKEERQQLGRENLKLATNRLIASSGATGAELAQIQYGAGQSGLVEKKDVVGFTKDAAIMGAAFDVDMKTAGDTMLAWRAGMDLNQEQALNLADSVNYLGNNMNATPADIAAMMRRYGAVSKKSGLTPEQGAALSSIFLNPGTEKEIAGTGQKNFLNALVAGESATKQRKEQWAELGFDPAEIASRMQEDAPAMIKEVLAAINDVDDDRQSAVITTLFGNESYAAIAPLLTNLKAVDKGFAQVSDQARYAGSMMKEAEGVADTGRTRWNVFTATVARLTTIVGESVMPAFNSVLDVATPFVGVLADAAERFPTVTSAIAVAAGGLVALKVGALGLKFAGLLVGQAFNKGSLARSRLDATTQRSATSADGAMRRLNATMDRMGYGGGRRGAGAGAGAGGGKGGKAGKAGKAGLRGRLAGMGKMGKVGVPLMLLANGATAAEGLANGDGVQVAGAVGSTGGALAGAWAGGAAGAAIGSVVPVVGTAVGGAVGSIAGGIAGSGAGEWLGEKAHAGWQWAFGNDDKPADAGLAGSMISDDALAASRSIADKLEVISLRLEDPPDRLATPDEAAQAVTNNTDARQTLNIQPGAIVLNGTTDPAENDRLIDRLMGKLRSEFFGGGGDNALGTRLGAGLTDGAS